MLEFVLLVCVGEHSADRKPSPKEQQVHTEAEFVKLLNSNLGTNSILDSPKRENDQKCM